ncbi:YfhL family 4Fe-4S dicluster ferredoxin [Insolitispirillum peregrinum]|uniref:4Fe-4S binding domain-containing protein n=1 Tax=Insolitispirillum peregrinum TaxID=80876 RepID=A0A1N7LNC4_9PROT|nr:YfhL family 4Fe-4S dicluster ferredoxin [Insolitispirillum peregrinum]SIS75320.1 4Fe-4S binding domain-containing protein [Insolitispirillum peregrinum]
MALRIEDDCIACGACPTECPNEAIAVGDPVYSIDPDRCTECVGANDTPQCVSVCPVDCIKADPAHRESQQALQAKYQALH